MSRPRIIRIAVRGQVVLIGATRGGVGIVGIATNAETLGCCRSFNRVLPFRWAAPCGSLVGKYADFFFRAGLDCIAAITFEAAGRLHRPLLRLRRCCAFYKHLSRPRSSRRAVRGQGVLSGATRGGVGIEGIATNAETCSVAMIGCCSQGGGIMIVAFARRYTSTRLQIPNAVAKPQGGIFVCSECAVLQSLVRALERVHGSLIHSVINVCPLRLIRFDIRLNGMSAGCVVVYGLIAATHVCPDVAR